MEIVIAYHEYEAWLLAGVESLRGHPLVRDDATYPEDPEAVRGAKRALQDLMLESYKETTHQVALTSRVDLREACERSRSMRRMVSAVSKLLAAGPRS